MYGLIYNTLRSLVVENHGEEAWNNICSKAAVDGGIYRDHQYYDEAMLYAVGAAASELLGTPLEDILEMFGAHFFETIKKSGHSSLLRTLGHNLYSFLVNLDSLHDHLSFTYTQMRAPSFRCEKTPNGLRLHYYSHRKGLEAIVIGIVKAVARSFFELEVDMKKLKCEELNEKLSYHCVFDIERISGPHDRLVGNQTNFMPVVPEESNVSETEGTQCQSEDVMEPPLLPPLSSRRNSTLFGSHLPDWPVTAQVFQSCFPFHIIFNKDLIIEQMGVSMMRLFPYALVTEARITDYFELARPTVDFTYDNIRSYVHNVFIVNIKEDHLQSSKEKKALLFRGEMVTLSGHDSCSLILFLCSPRITSVEELQNQGLYISDIPIHDATRDLILLNRHFRVEMNIAEELEKAKCELEQEKARADRLLHSMLPHSIAKQLKLGDNFSATEYSSVTILFSDIKGFTIICSNCTPMCVVGMLNNLYTRFDSLIEKHNVYKVETIGDAYMVAAGLLDTSVNHAEAVANMAFDMRDAAKYVAKPATEETLQIRIGIHSGPVVAGVVGLKMPRYCLFGDTVNTASRMESHGEADRVHISHATYQLLIATKRKFTFVPRGKIKLKGLGMRETYFLEPFSEHDDIAINLAETENLEPPSPGVETENLEPPSPGAETENLEPPSPGDYQRGMSRTTSFVRYTHLVPEPPKKTADDIFLSVADRNDTDELNLRSPPHMTRSSHPALLPTEEEEGYFISVPGGEVLKRCREEEVQAKEHTGKESHHLMKEMQPTSLVFSLLLLCFPLTLGLFLTFSKGS